MNIKTKITKLHYAQNPESILFLTLKIFSYFYEIGSDFKNFLYDKNLIKSKKTDAYVISVGNLTTGGVGKTPVVSEIAKYLVNNNEKVAIISRGYGGKLDNSKVNIISDGINLYYKADMAGDEPYWLAVNLNMCAVLTCSDRYKAAKYAVEQMGIKYIILDDGFQHRKFYRDIDIILIDSVKQFGNENLLPAGPLRENLNGFKRADKIVIVSKDIEHSNAEKLSYLLKEKYQKESFVCKIEPDYIYNIITGEHLEKNTDIIALSAIGQPEQFYNFLKKDFEIKEYYTFDDHYKYSINDIPKTEYPIVTTEKDAVKLAPFGNPNIYALKLKTILEIDKLIKK